MLPYWRPAPSLVLPRHPTTAMFKKLKKKIEEGEEGAVDQQVFSPRRLPGSAVRSLPSPELAKDSEGLKSEVDPEKRGTEIDRDGDDYGDDYANLVDGENTEISGEGTTDLPLTPTYVPKHLQSSLKPDAANAILLAKISELQNGM